jgi:hypothetical protein
VGPASSTKASSKLTLPARKLNPAAAQLFMGGFSRPPSADVYCSSDIPKTSCGSACSFECDRKAPTTACADGLSCTFKCDDSADEVIAEDVSSDDEEFENASTSNETYSSLEDTKDAFEDYDKTPEPSVHPKKKAKMQDYKTFVETDAKNTRQRGDAASLKHYTYGQLKCKHNDFLEMK